MITNAAYSQRNPTPTRSLTARLDLAMNGLNLSEAGRNEWLCNRSELQISQRLAQRWLNGDEAPNPDHIALLADLLVVEADWLEFGAPPNEHSGT